MRVGAHRKDVATLPDRVEAVREDRRALDDEVLEARDDARAEVRHLDAKPRELRARRVAQRAVEVDGEIQLFAERHERRVDGARGDEARGSIAALPEKPTQRARGPNGGRDVADRRPVERGVALQAKQVRSHVSKTVEGWRLVSIEELARLVRLGERDFRLRQRRGEGKLPDRRARPPAASEDRVEDAIPREIVERLRHCAQALTVGEDSGLGSATIRSVDGRSRRALSVALCAYLLSGCQPGENAVLIEATSEAYVQTVDVTVVTLDARRRRVHRAFPVNRDTPDIDAVPIRIAVELDGPSSVLVHLSALSESGATQVATRCYEVSGVMHDSVRLVFPPPGSDPDMDGFPADPHATCFDASGAPCGAFICPAEVGGDCAPDDASVSPGAVELCEDSIDQDCSAGGDPSGDIECRDDDGDGWRTCSGGSAPGTCDCDDVDPDVSPSATESDDPADGTCGDGVDQDCDGVFVACDRDRDGYRADREVGGTPDCDDTNAAINPGAAERCTPEGETPVDENCNGLLDEAPECVGPDLDRDGVDGCDAPGAPPRPNCDCNDCDSGVKPGVVDRCGDGIDQDCDGVDPPCPAGDMDGDGDPAIASGGGDCNDANPTINSFAPEHCGDGIDQDCDSVPDDGCDGDTDGDGWVETGALADCEGDPTRNPGMPELCNGIDDDCDGTADELLLPPVGGDPGFPEGATGCVRPDASVPGCTGSACVVDYMSTFGHCHVCRDACPPTRALECIGGVCNCPAETSFVGPCSDEQLCCGTGCENYLVDIDNCGECGNECNRVTAERNASQPAADQCVGGVCQCGAAGACGPNLMCCGAACVGYNDINNCGACGNVCFSDASSPARMTCPAATLRCECAVANRADCNSNSADGCERDLQTDVNHCGGCGNRCSFANASAECTGGSCHIASCNSGWGNCDGNEANGCETQLNSLSNCASCGTSCSRANATATCATGSCAIAMCSSGWGNCDGNDGNGCELRLNTTANCGGCGVGCAPPFATGTCSSGSCQIMSCDTLRGDCGGGVGNGCETDFTTTSNCNGCGVSCTRANATPTCAGGMCRIGSCSSGWDNCDGTDGNGCETSLNQPSSCGSCTNMCSLMHTATYSCPSGTCRVASCSSGWGNCDGSHPNGCETPTNTTTNCGACGMACMPQHATGDCSTGTCAIASCTSGWADCNGGAGNGCETQLGTDANCNGCGNTCTAPQTCGGGGTPGTCGCTPMPCGGRCGSVPDGCGGMISCGGCPGASNMCCNSMCVDTDTSNMHCGGCNMPCTSPQTCGGGSAPPGMCG